jgi:hypothetical protein
VGSLVGEKERVCQTDVDDLTIIEAG